MSKYRDFAIKFIGLSDEFEPDNSHLSLLDFADFLDAQEASRKPPRATESERREFETACHRKSFLIWDNLGIQVRVSDLPTAQAHTLLSELMYGSGSSRRLAYVLSRLWCLKIRPWLMPRRQAQIEQAHSDLQELQQVLLLNAVIDEGRRLGLTE